MSAVAQERDLYSSEFDAFVRDRTGDPDWLRGLRREGMERFAALGFPTHANEQWRSTNVAPIARSAFRRADDDSAGAGETTTPLPRIFPAPHPQLVFVNGRLAPELSTVNGTPGVQLSGLRSALARDTEALEPYLGRIAVDAANPFNALNTAFLDDGAVVRIAAGAVVEPPIHLVFVSEPGSEPTVSHPRILIVAGPGSQASVVETYVGAPGQAFTNVVTEIATETGSILEHTKVQRESETAFHVATIEARQGRGSHLTSHNVSLGGALTRNDINVLLAAEGAECTLNGLFIGAGTQLVDNHTLIDHASPHCTSRELYKGILDGKSRGVFHGKIIVRPDAQKTDAVQTNRNLLLSREALVSSTPALEIRADDVKCRHGSTIGQLDPMALFYLRSRGISEADARALLVYGFAADVAGRIRIPAIREGIEAFLGLRLPGAAGARELA